MSESRDKIVCKRMKERYRELAGMLKEKGKGVYKTLAKVVSRFAIQEGIREVKAWEYVGLFQKAGLLIMTDGLRKWRYNEDAEWELFKINI